MIIKYIYRNNFTEHIPNCQSCSAIKHFYAETRDSDFSGPIALNDIYYQGSNNIQNKLKMKLLPISNIYLPN